MIREIIILIRGIAQFLLLPIAGLVFFLAYVTWRYYRTVYLDGSPAKYIPDWEVTAYCVILLLASFPTLVAMRSNAKFVRLVSTSYLLILSGCFLTLIYMYFKSQLDFGGAFKFLNK
jgi:hypothetical protein